MAKRSRKRQVAGHDVAAKAADGRSISRRMPARLRLEWLSGVALFLGILVTFSPALWSGYIWDDDLVVTANPVVVGPLGLTEIWTTAAADICPLTLSTFWLEHAFWGRAPMPYHLVTILLHGCCAIVLGRVLLALRVRGAWLGASLWALHPVQVESVAWVAEMKNTESGLFFLLSILFFIESFKPLDGRKKAWPSNNALTLLFAALAMASKSSTVILPVVLCLCAWWMQGQWQWRILLKLWPIFLMSLIAGMVSMRTQGLQMAAQADPQWVRSWPERLVTAGDAVWFYLGKLLWPYPLVAVYPRWQIDAHQWISYLPLLAVGIVLLVSWYCRGSWGRPWFFAFAYFLVALIPILGLVNIDFFRLSFVADHFQYLAAMGPLALVGAGIVRLAELLPSTRIWLPATLGLGILLVLGVLSWRQSQIYQDEETLWTATLASNPACWVGYNNLGLVLFEKGQVAAAIQDYQDALKLNPNFAEAHNNLGNALGKHGQLDEAIAQYRKVLELTPTKAKGHFNLAVVLGQKGQPDEAIEEYQKSLKIDPTYAQAYNNLANELMQKGRLDDAISECEAALKIDPNFADAHNSLGIALAQKGQLTDAVVQFQAAVQLKPDLNGAQNNLARAQSILQQRAAQK